MSSANQVCEKIPVWIVEDDPMVNSLICRVLKNKGFSCKQFYSVDEFIKEIDNNVITEKNIILLIDYLLGEKNSLELLDYLEKKQTPKPFIVMTGHGDEKTAANLLRRGAKDYIIKEKNFVFQVVQSINRLNDQLILEEKLEQSQLELKKNTLELKLLNKKINFQKLEIESEKLKTDQLLHSILPRKIAKELLLQGYIRPRKYESASILFADVIGFSKLANKKPPIELVTRLDNYFYVFDEIIEALGLEKIKTIGDCYMCAGGVPEPNSNHPIISVLAGLHMQKAVKNMENEFNDDFPGFQLRLGIHSGEVVAGVVGKIKFAYDIWGDAVNVASRMVDTGERGRVNISRNTFDKVKDFFECEERGEILTKSNTKIKMFFVERLKPELSDDLKGLIPNSDLAKSLDLNGFAKFYEKYSF